MVQVLHKEQQETVIPAEAKSIAVGTIHYNDYVGSSSSSEEDYEGGSRLRLSLSSSSSSSSSSLSLSTSQQRTTCLPLHHEEDTTTTSKYPCSNTHKRLPSEPSTWPQAPLMLCPTPNSNTRIRGIRLATSTEYIKDTFGFCPGCLLPINTGYEEANNQSCFVIDFESDLFIGTLLMRIKGSPSPHHQRQQDDKEDTTTTTKQKKKKKRNYFDNKSRKFQAIVKGYFKTPNIKISDCVTGQIFHNENNTLNSKLPPKFIVSSFTKIVKTLAPQLEIKMDGPRPRFLSPLVATAQTVLVGKAQEENGANKSNDPQEQANIQQRSAAEEEENKDLSNKTVTIEATKISTTTTKGEKLSDYNKDNERVVTASFQSKNIQDPLEEPLANDERSIMKEAVTNINSKHTSIQSRQKARKKAFNKLYADHKTNNPNNEEEQPAFKLDVEYTFEFYQHLLLFGGKDLAIDMGRPVGKIPIAPITNGQPIKFMSAHQTRNAQSDTGSNDDKEENHALNYLWSFDVWHESLYPYAKQAYDASAVST